VNPDLLPIVIANCCLTGNSSPIRLWKSRRPCRSWELCLRTPEPGRPGGPRMRGSFWSQQGPHRRATHRAGWDTPPGLHWNPFSIDD